mgnify:CR=1 FL=1
MTPGHAQATEHLWGISKQDVARKPRYSLAGVMNALRESLEKRATPELCKSLIGECHRYAALFYEEDAKVFGDDGIDRKPQCAAAFCSLQPHLYKTGKAGQNARAAPTRQCSGPCGHHYHQECVLGMEGQWPKFEPKCHCGCGDPDNNRDDSDASRFNSDDDDIVDLTVNGRQGDSVEEARLKAARKRVEQLLSGRFQLTMAKTGGDKSNFSSAAR